MEIVDKRIHALYSRLFLVEKVLGWYRPISILSPFNTYTALYKFRMFTINLKNMYFHILIHSELRPFLWFVVN